MDISTICAILDCNRPKVMAEHSHNLNSHTVVIIENFRTALQVKSI
jgi:hypothetical protein